MCKTYFGVIGRNDLLLYFLHVFLVAIIHHNAVQYKPLAQDSFICLAYSFLLYKVLHFYYTKRQCKFNKSNSFGHIV